MNALWTYFWPAFGAGLVVGVIAGADRFPARARRRNGAGGRASSRRSPLAALWHGPLGAADRLPTQVERGVREGARSTMK